MSGKRPNNQSENKRFEDATKSVGLSKEEARKMHEDLQNDPDKDGKSYQELKDIAKDYKGQ